MISFLKQTLLQNIKFFQSCFQNLLKYLRWSTFALWETDFKPLTVYEKYSILDILGGSESAFSE